jgi:hypothetical protein
VEKITNNSHLKFATLFDVDNVLFWDVPEFPIIEKQNDDLLHTVTDNDLGRIDLLAYDYYRDEELWWVIMLANNKYNINHFSIGEQIVIPSPRYVTEYVAKLKG